MDPFPSPQRGPRSWNAPPPFLIILRMSSANVPLSTRLVTGFPAYPRPRIMLYNWIAKEDIFNSQTPFRPRGRRSAFVFLFPPQTRLSAQSLLLEAAAGPSGSISRFDFFWPLTLFLLPDPTSFLVSFWSRELGFEAGVSFCVTKHRDSYWALCTSIRRC